VTIHPVIIVEVAFQPMPEVDRIALADPLIVCELPSLITAPERAGSSLQITRASSGLATHLVGAMSGQQLIQHHT
jgi:hypothetical protein